MSEASRAGVDVGSVVDSAQFWGLPSLVMACAALVMVLDGFDIQIIGFAAPALAADLEIERAALAPAFAASLIGMAFGAFALGPFGDRRGRRPAILVSIVVFGLGTLATAGASNLELLIALRFATGIGLGGALPNATALMAEFAPPKVRGQTIAAAIVGIPVGGMLGAAIAAKVIAAIGWPTLFVIGGLLPLMTALGLYFVLPESPRFLAASRGREGELADVLNRIAKENRFSASQTFTLPSDLAPKQVGIAAVLAPGWRLDSLALWIVFISNLFAVYCFFNWAPVVLTKIGLDLATAVNGSLIFNTAGVVGSILVSWLVARLGSRWLLAALVVIGALSLVYIGSLVADPSTSPPSVASIMIAFAIAGCCILSVQVTMYAVAAHVYPTQCRSAGVGWAAGMGRLGGVLSAFVGGLLMARAGAAGFFVAIAAALGLTVVGVLMLKRHLPSSLPATRVPAVSHP